MLTNVKKISYSAMDHHQKSITSRGSPVAHACRVWSTSVSPFVIHPVYRMTDNDYIT